VLAEKIVGIMQAGIKSLVDLPVLPGWSGNALLLIKVTLL
jgi:hypothetical protein